MNNELIFDIASTSFVLAWLGILIANFLPLTSRWRKGLLFLGGRVTPILFLIAFFCGVIITKPMAPQGDIFTYDGVITLLSVPERILNIWIEMLAYMLLLTRWIHDDAQKRGLPPLVSGFCLLVSFISAGLSLLVYGLTLGAIYLITKALHAAPSEPPKDNL